MTKEVSIKVWIKRGNMLLNAYALDYTDPEHPYNQALRQNVNPEEYGLRNPISERFDKYSRSELINMILDLEKEIDYGSR